MGTFIPILMLICAYLLGSVPFGLLIGKLRKIDIREYGSHNIGATNASRTLGAKLGLLVFLLDFLKGSCFVFIARLLIESDSSLFTLKIHPLFYGLAAVLGHIFPIFLKFKGGKGVSSFAAIIFCTNWLLTIIGLCIFFLVLKLKKYVSLSSISCALILPIIALVFAIVNLPIGMYYASYSYFYTLTIAISGILLIIMHRSNIKRLINHEERKIKWM